MGQLSSIFNQGFFGQSYGQWALFLFLFVFLWTAAVSLNVMIRRGTGV